MQSRKGFSLVELLIVVAIILVIAAVAIPNLLKSKIAANEASAVGSLREIRTAQTTYSISYPAIGYSPSLARLGGAFPCAPSPATSCLLDSSVTTAVAGSGGKAGYVFAVTAVASGTFNSEYVAGSSPITSGFSGNHDFCVTSDGVLRKVTSGNGDVPVTTVAACQAFPDVVN